MTKTVKYLKDKLANLPDDAMVWACEGEATGICVVYKDYDPSNPNHILLEWIDLEHDEQRATD